MNIHPLLDLFSSCLHHSVVTLISVSHQWEHTPVFAWSLITMGQYAWLYTFHTSHSLTCALSVTLHSANKTISLDGSIVWWSYNILLQRELLSPLILSQAQNVISEFLVNTCIWQKNKKKMKTRTYLNAEPLFLYLFAFWKKKASQYLS